MQYAVGMALVSDIFQKNIDKLFCSMPKLFGITDNILIAKFNEQGGDNKATLDKVLRVCRLANLKPNKDRCVFRCTRISFFGEVIWQGVGPDLRKVKPLINLMPLKSKKELQLFLGILN